MRTNILSLIGLGLALSLSACSKWTEPESEDINKMLAKADAELAESHQRYLENLRAYKESDHQVTFGWFGGWSADGPKSRYLYHLPDSTDFVSIWGGWSNLTEAQKADLKRAQTEKGIKALTCVLMFQIGDAITPPKPLEDSLLNWSQWQHKFWGWDDSKPETIGPAVDRYADALLDTIFKYDYDGFDLDAEPSYAQPFPTNKELWRKQDTNGMMLAERIIRRMAKRIGPMAETPEGRKKLLVVDGEPQAFPANMGKLFNYFILQAYSCRSYSDLDRRVARQVQHFQSALTPAEVAAKIIFTETFESHGANAGVQYVNREGQVFASSYLGMADYQPLQGRKGGIGSYHMEVNFAQTPEYKHVREGINMMNPPVK